MTLIWSANSNGAMDPTHLVKIRLFSPTVERSFLELWGRLVWGSDG